MTLNDRARSAWRKIVWRLSLESRGSGLTWAQNEEAIALIEIEMAAAATEAIRSAQGDTRFFVADVTGQST